MIKIKSIEVNQEVYVSKKDVDEKVKDMEKEISNLKEGKPKILSEEMLVDEINVLGIGTVKIGGDFHAVKLSTEYLEKVIKGLKAIAIGEKGLDSIDIIWAKDYPCIIGKLGKDGKATGFILAPRVDCD